ncbi:bifunctional riboflavin kinase/FAD synthetase [Alcaligenaceae bacterium SJ-26]|nr:bifunctional riboflavin kinase/FAD synthetase [Alcaligenaceae bacterium SJ-26]
MSFPASNGPCALTIGNFDGVHLGHQAILARVRDAAAARDLSPAVMTFEPHPKEYFAHLRGQPELAPARIYTLRDRLAAIRACGIRQISLQRFNAHLAAMPAEAFVADLLANSLQARWLLVGRDFRFGHQRRGNIELLRELGPQHGIEVEVMEDVTDPAGLRISSSDIRQALTEGNLDDAKAHLGRAWTISGHVLHGRKLGRTLGFPTMNIRPPARCAARAGVYIVRIHGLDDAPFAGVANLGMRPTVDQSRRMVLEVHALTEPDPLLARDPAFSKARLQAYGKLVRIEFLQLLRDELRFSDLDSLTAAIQNDVRLAYDYFSRHGL